MAKKKSIITKYMDACLICGRPCTQIHHAISGNPGRKLADEDGLLIPLCNDHHIADGCYSVHGNYAIARWSKIVGQLAYELNYVTKDNPELREEARESFRKRYGKSFL